MYGRKRTRFCEGGNLLDDNLLLPGGTAPGGFPSLEAADGDGGPRRGLPPRPE